jgi:hypothetical protein
MPEPKEGESKSAYIGRCVRQVMGEGKSQDAALGQCYGMWRQHQKKKRLFEDVLKQTVQGVHVATAIGNEQDRKRRQFNTVVANESVSTRRPANEELDDTDDGETGRGDLPPTRARKWWNMFSPTTGATYPKGQRPRLLDFDADDLELDRDFDDDQLQDNEDRVPEDDDDEEEENEKRWRVPIKVTKADPDQRLVFGWASVAAVDGEAIVDKQGDIIPVEELEKAVVEYVLTSRDGGDMHERRGVSRLAASLVFTPELEKVGIIAKDEQGRIVHGWFTGFKVDDDDLWAAFKRGERPEFSIGGHAFPVEVEVGGEAEGDPPARPFDANAEHGAVRWIEDLLTRQRAEAMHQITNAMGGTRKDEGGIWLGVKPGTADRIASSVAKFGISEHNLAILQHELEVAAHSAGTHTNGQIVGDVNRGLTREEQDLLRARNTRLDDNIRYFAKRYGRERSAELVGKKYDARGILRDNPNPKWTISETTRDTLRDIVAKAIAGRWNLSTIADRIADAALFSHSRAVMVARTEVNRAHNAATLEAGKKAQEATGKRYLKVWTLGPDPCEECEENAAKGEIEIDDTWTDDDESEAPPLHPKCMCELELIELDDEETEKRDQEDEYWEPDPLPEKQLAPLRDEARKLVDRAEIDRSYHVLEIADRSKDGRRVYIDGHVPKRVEGVDTGVSLAWHELGEFVAMNHGYKYLDAHRRVGNALEYEYVGDKKWEAYQKAFEKIEHHKEEVTRAPADLDLQVFQGEELKHMKALVEKARK